MATYFYTQSDSHCTNLAFPETLNSKLQTFNLVQIMIWDLIQQTQIDKTKRDIRDTQRDNLETVAANHELQERVSKLSLITQAVWSFLKEKHGLDEIDLMNRIEEIDMGDGVRDGKVTAVVHTCLGCGRKISTKYKSCIYCESPNPKYSPFVEINPSKD